MLLVDRQCVLGGAGQADEHVGAEVKGPVVPATVGHRLDREVGQVRELVGDEPTHLFRVDGDALRQGAEIRNISH
ncbi:hypothetical protein [Verrucosispora sioxanthis]|uniref:hypothetical protein n=1 Tax=Verrucosispora sioxanthis TaxID=2499994 RepID=UPI00209F4644|nr:hypothetical protein [Verrucosispora sioxanthis]